MAFTIKKKTKQLRCKIFRFNGGIQNTSNNCATVVWTTTVFVFFNLGADSNPKQQRQWDSTRTRSWIIPYFTDEQSMARKGQYLTQSHLISDPTVLLKNTAWLPCLHQDLSMKLTVCSLDLKRHDLYRCLKSEDIHRIRATSLQKLKKSFC